MTYCAEQFENDGSPVSTIVKGVKRAMAGEYSRELSTKVFVGQCRLIELGFRQGAPAGYGLRRVMIDQNGVFKGDLKKGEHKAITTYRVTLVPGPAQEVQVVHDIYRWLIQDGLNFTDIARRLDSAGVVPHVGTQWTLEKVRQILTNEKYIGTNLYNKCSGKLNTLRIYNPPEMWIRKEDAFEGIVPKDVFQAAQNILAERSFPYTEDFMLEKLRQLFKATGCLSGNAIQRSPDMPSSQRYVERFGSLKQAYERVGYWTESSLEYQEVNRRIRRMYPEIMERTRATIAQMGGTVWLDPDTDLLHINQELVICIVLARCYTEVTGRRRWHIRFDPAKFAPDITVAIRLNDANLAEQDYYLLPKLDLPAARIKIYDNVESDLDSFRFNNLDFFYGMAQRTSVARPSRPMPACQFPNTQSPPTNPRSLHHA